MEKESNKISFFNRIDVRIIAFLLILFALISTFMNIIIDSNIRDVYESNYSRQVHLVNTLMASFLDSEDVLHYAELMRNQDDGFKERQVQFYYDRMELFRLLDEDAPQERQAEVFDRINVFYDETAAFKDEKYWQIIDELRHLKETSQSTYVYVLADTGLEARNGEKLYTFIFDAEDTGAFHSPDTDGLGTCGDGENSLYLILNEALVEMSFVEYYTGEYGELYFAYSPIYDDDGNVIAVLGTDLNLGDMNAAISRSHLLINISIIAFLSVLLVIVVFFLSRRVTMPLRTLTGIAYGLVEGNTDITVPESMMKRSSELGMLAKAFKEAIETTAREKRNFAETQRRLQSIAIKEQEANQLKSRFLATMSHEIRTPMNAIIGMSELALREAEPDTKNEHIQMARQAASNLLTIINDILDFSKIEAGKLKIMPGEYSFTSLLSDVTNIIKTWSMDSTLSFSVYVDSKIPHTLYGDNTRIRQALINILNNAAKYTNEGSVSLGVYLGKAGQHHSGNRKAESGETKAGGDEITLIFEVKDTGIGIKPEDMDKLFTDFTQFEYDRRRGVQGVGLGLVITRNIIMLMGGDIAVSSQFGEGSTFTITLPQKVYNHTPLAEVADAGKKNVLIFEEDEAYSESLTRTVRNLGVHSTRVEKRDDLLERIESGQYNYLFISYELFGKCEAGIMAAERACAERAAALANAGRTGEDANGGRTGAEGGQPEANAGQTLRTVVLTSYGEPVLNKNADVLIMPVYCTDIADILNGKSVIHSLSAEVDDGFNATFTAPSARVLVVDDLETNLKVARGLLMQYNMQIDICPGGAEAVIAVRKTASKDPSERYDIIFMDHVMPVMDGVEATQCIRNLGGDEAGTYYKQVPIIALTANAMQGMAEMFIESGFNDFISKPIDIVRLNEILKKWIPKNKQENG